MSYTLSFYHFQHKYPPKINRDTLKLLSPNELMNGTSVGLMTVELLEAVLLLPGCEYMKAGDSGVVS